MKNDIKDGHLVKNSFINILLELLIDYLKLTIPKVRFINMLNSIKLLFLIVHSEQLNPFIDIIKA